MTARLTAHARQRCKEMGIATKRVKHALRDKHVVARHPDPHCRNLHIISDLEPTLIVVVAASEPDVVVTVLWRSDEPWTRDDPPPVAAAAHA